jgi:hypothetical protein
MVFATVGGAEWKFRACWGYGLRLAGSTGIGVNV